MAYPLNDSNASKRQQTTLPTFRHFPYGTASFTQNHLCSGEEIVRQGTKISLLHQFVILLFCGTLFFTSLGSTHLWDQDEAFFAGSAAEMWRAGDWIVPRFNGEVFSHKPPWMFWMMMLGYGIWGETAFAARFFAAVFGVGTAICVYHFACQWFDRRVALWSSLAMGSMLMFAVVSRAASPDTYLTFFSMLGICWLVRPPVQGELIEPNQSSTYDPKQRITGSVIRWSAAYLAMGFAVLVKGPIGVILPLAVVGLYLMLSLPAKSLPANASRGQRLWASLAWLSPLNFWRSLIALAPLRGAVLVMLVAAPWYVAVSLQTGGEFMSEFIGTHNVGRFTGAMDNHSGSIFYYIPAVLIGTFPWSILLVPALLIFRQTMLLEQSQAARGTTLLLAWSSVYLGFFSIAATKLPSYVLPAYPALAMVAGLCVARLIDNRNLVWKWWPRVAFSVWMMLGLAVLISFPLIASLTRSGTSLLESYGLSGELNTLLWQLYPLGLVPLLAGMICLWLWEADRRNTAMQAVAASCGLILFAMLVYAPQKIDRLQNSHLLVRTATSGVSEDVELGQFGVFRPSLIYYGARPVKKLNQPEEIAAFLSEGNRAIFVREERVAELEAAVGYQFQVVGSQPRFPKQGNVMVLTQPTELAVKEDDGILRR